MTTKISLQQLLESGAHFGHQAKRWNPKMAEYLYGQQEGVHIFDLTKTKPALEEALAALAKYVKEGKEIVFVGTKKQVRDKIAEVAGETGSHYVNLRWLGGTLTNFSAIKKSIDKLAEMKEARDAGLYNKYTKKERLLIDREIERLEKLFGGIARLTRKPDVLIIVDTKKEDSAVREAIKTEIETIGVVDSNSDPTKLTWVIPMNDDASMALNYILDLMKETILEAKKSK